MNKSKRKVSSALRSGGRFPAVVCAWVLTAAAGCTLMTANVLEAERQRQEALSASAVAASAELLEMAVESGVAIAKTIYTNETLYHFLNTEYKSSSDYFDAYYQLGQNSPLTPADSNFVEKYMVYTANSSVMSGGSIMNIRFAHQEEWYSLYKRMNKPMILYCDPTRSSLSLIRSLDYYSTPKGECFLKLDLNISLLQNNCRGLEFDGALFITSGSVLLYSSRADAKNAGELHITPEFESFTQNYYTADIEYYALAARTPPGRMLLWHWPLLVLTVLCGAGTLLLVWHFVRTDRRRVTRTEAIYQAEGSLASLRGEQQGHDIIGVLTDIGIALSERLANRKMQYRQSQEELAERTAAYRKLYGQSLRLDAEHALLHAGLTVPTEEMRPIGEELAQVQEAAPGHVTVSGALPEHLLVPSGALVRIALRQLRGGGQLLVSGTETGELLLEWRHLEPPEASALLRLRAIFEEGDVCGDFPFEPGSRYNPYLRLCHHLGEKISLRTAEEEDGFVMTMRVLP